MHDHAVHRDLDAIGFGCQASPEAYDWCPTLPLYTIVEHHVIFFTVLFRSFRQLGVPYFGVLRNKDPTIWGTIFGSTNFGNSHIIFFTMLFGAS